MPISSAAPSHFRSAALRVYSAIFEETFFEVADGEGGERALALADTLSAIFKESMVERIEAAIRGEADPLVKVVREARARPRQGKKLTEKKEPMK